jgi:hypothetical protein
MFDGVQRQSALGRQPPDTWRSNQLLPNHEPSVRALDGTHVRDWLRCRAEVPAPVARALLPLQISEHALSLPSERSPTLHLHVSLDATDGFLASPRPRCFPGAAVAHDARVNVE